MLNLSSLLQQSMGEQGLNQLSSHLGVNSAQTESIVDTLAPLITGGLSSNAAKADGANALVAALDKDHDGSILDDIPGFLSGDDGSAGEGILKHVLGDKQGGIEGAVGEALNIDSQTIHKAMTSLAPLVMGALGKAKKDVNLDSSSISNFLQGQITGGGASTVVSQFLDRDGDGQVKDDIFSMLWKFVLGLFKR